LQRRGGGDRRKAIITQCLRADEKGRGKGVSHGRAYSVKKKEKEEALLCDCRIEGRKKKERANAQIGEERREVYCPNIH